MLRSSSIHYCIRGSPYATIGWELSCTIDINAITKASLIMPLEQMIQMLPTNGTIERTSKKNVISFMYRMQASDQTFFIFFLSFLVKFG